MPKNVTYKHSQLRFPPQSKLVTTYNLPPWCGSAPKQVETDGEPLTMGLGSGPQLLLRKPSSYMAQDHHLKSHLPERLQFNWCSNFFPFLIASPRPRPRHTTGKQEHLQHTSCSEKVVSKQTKKVTESSILQGAQAT